MIENRKLFEKGDIIVCLIALILLLSVIVSLINDEHGYNQFCIKNGYEDAIFDSPGHRLCVREGNNQVLESREFTKINGKYYWRAE